MTCDQTPTLFYNILMFKFKNVLNIKLLVDLLSYKSPDNLIN